MSQIQLNFNEISLRAEKFVPKLLFIYTNMEINNNDIYIYYKNINNSENLSFSQNLAQSRQDFDSRSLEVKVLGGDELLNEDTGSQCSVGHCYASGEYSYYQWNSTSSSGLLIGPMIYSLNDHYDFGIISLDYENVVPTFSIRNDDDKELIITGDAPVSSHNVHICKSGYTTHLTCGRVSEGGDILYNLIITDFVSYYSDNGGFAFSFDSPQKIIFSCCKWYI
ncbi:hypothetical protein C2G38_2075277 [Gigaspora rosea]|uniref:Uncharacterized protein n=1 Tax=Gigaspora rosea TaxID=44941 RepID=A0A397VNJ5_9GLOM|nr:hypothetical protein C2G38_2075277 [Gigaspora rosea]